MGKRKRVFYECKEDIDNCCYNTNRKPDYRRHLADVHEIGVNWLYCTFPGCEDKFKQKGNLIQHLRTHGIGVKWHPCPDCNEKFNKKSNLDRHLAEIHKIGVKWYSCDYPECTYKAKRNSEVNRHKKDYHDIGDKECDFCGEDHYSHIKYEDHVGQHYVCKACYFKATGKHSRSEHVWSKYLDKYDIVPISGSDDSLKSLGGCQTYRPDRISIGLELVELDECDENQHKHNSGNYTCDEKRISDIYDETGICGKTLIVTRFNPDNYKPPEGEKKKAMNERLRNLVLLKRRLRKNPPRDKIHIFYLYYDYHNPRIAKNIPHTLIS